MEELPRHGLGVTSSSRRRRHCWHPRPPSDRDLTDRTPDTKPASRESFHLSECLGSCLVSASRPSRWLGDRREDPATRLPVPSIWRPRPFRNGDPLAFVFPGSRKTVASLPLGNEPCVFEAHRCSSEVRVDTSRSIRPRVDSPDDSPDDSPPSGR